MDITQQIKDHFAARGYKVQIDKVQAADINDQFTHNVIFLEGQSSIRLFRLVQKYFGQQIRVVSTNKTKVMIFRFEPDGHEEVTGICKVCGCNDQMLCDKAGKCFWNEQDLADACNEAVAHTPPPVTHNHITRNQKHSTKLQEQL
jgi:hypothetical protein